MSKSGNSRSRPLQTHGLTLTGFYLAATFALALAAYAYWISARQAEAAAWVSHTHQVLDELARMRAALSDVNRGARAYLVNGNARDLAPYEGGVARVQAGSARLRDLTADNLGQQARVESLDAVLGVQLAMMRGIVDARRLQGPGAAQKLLDSAATVEHASRVQAGLNGVEEHERELFRLREGDVQADIRIVKLSVSALLATMAILFVTLYVTIRRRQAAERQWRQSDERFRLMSDNTLEYGIFMLDPAGNVSTWNPGAQRINGYRADEILGRHFSCFYPPEDIASQKPRRELDTADVAGHVRDEGWRLRKDGTRFWAEVLIVALRDDSGAMRGYAKLTRDMTERRLAEDRLRSEMARREAVDADLRRLNESLTESVNKGSAELESTNENLQREMAESLRAQSSLQHSQSHLNSLLESAMDAIISVDESGHIVLFNAAAEKTFGCLRDEALGAPLAWFLPERFRATHSEHMRQFGSAGASSRRMGGERIVTGMRRNGEEFPIDASISHFDGADGKFFTVILRDATTRVRAEDELQRSKAELRELAAIASSAREEEKSRVARELHDELAQSLSALKMDLTLLQGTLAPGQERLRSKLDAMQAVADGAVIATRRIAADLRPLILDDLGLVPAAEWLLQTFTKRTGVHCDIAIDPPQLELPDPYATTIFRILQESLSNITKHAHASLVDVTVKAVDGEIILKVWDNGRGFQPDDPRKPNSYGLAGLRERVYLLDGAVRVDSAPGRGTTIEVSVPCASASTCSCG